MKFSIIVAVDKENGIGKEGKLPWKIPADLKHFQKLTKGKGRNVVIMGRKTWESLPSSRRPLPERKNVVITRSEDLKLPKGVLLAHSFDQALELGKRIRPDHIFVIGGAQIFAEALQHKNCAAIFLTRVFGRFHCDTYFSKFDPEKFRRVFQSAAQEENGIRFCFEEYRRIR